MDVKNPSNQVMPCGLATNTLFECGPEGPNAVLRPNLHLVHTQMFAATKEAAAGASEE